MIKKIKITKTFVGKLSMEGDDGYCFGIHLNQNGKSELIDYIDKIAEKNKQKQAKIKIIFEIEPKI
jgi:hypothetical protein